MTKSEEIRVVLVKPDDVLVFGNVGHVTAEVAKRLHETFEALGIKKVVVFAEDIDMARVRDA